MLLNEKINLFEKRVLYELLEIADKITNGYEDFPAIPFSDKATLAIILSYFEMIGKYVDGYVLDDKNSKSGYYFQEGLKEVLKGLRYGYEESVRHVVNFICELLYKGGRCRLYHVSSLDKRIEIKKHKKNKAIQLDFPSGSREELGDWSKFKLYIDINELVGGVIKNCKSYIEMLRLGNDKALIKNFSKRFDYDYKPVNIKIDSLKTILDKITEDIIKS